MKVKLEIVHLHNIFWLVKDCKIWGLFEGLLYNV